MKLFRYTGNLFIFFALFIFCTGGVPFIPLFLTPVIEQKPWIHRLFVLGISMFGFLIFMIQKRNWSLPARTCLILFFAAAAGLGSAAACLRHNSFESGFDMAIFVQAVWNTLKGNFLYSSIKGGICLLGDHFSPLLAILVLPYKLWSDPRLLLILQAVLAASSVFPLFLIAKV